MRTRRIKTETQSASYDLSISDLMAALCCIFLVFLSKTVLQLNLQKSEYAAKNEVAEEYRSMQSSLYQDLFDEFESDFQKWNLTLTPDLTFHFRDDDALFQKDSAKLQLPFEKILDDFFPRLIKVISNEDYANKIEEIRIEGHTAENIRQTRDEDYKTGMELSQERTREVLFYCLQNTKLKENKIQNENSVEWVRKRIAAIGYSNSIPSTDETGKIDWEKSRRVEIKIKTNSDAVITDIQNLSGK